MWIRILPLKGYTYFVFLQKRSKMKFVFDSPGYHTTGSQFFSQLKFEYLIENLTKNENILTHWSKAQLVSKDEKKTGGRKSHWTVRLSSVWL